MTCQPGQGLDCVVRSDEFQAWAPAEAQAAIATMRMARAAPFVALKHGKRRRTLGKKSEMAGGRAENHAGFHAYRAGEM